MNFARLLITGASRGLGAALARQAAARGHSLFLVARNGEELAQRAGDLQRSGARIVTYVADLRSADACRATIEAATAALGGVDALINNAGIGAYRPFVDYSAQAIDEVLALNLAAPMQLARVVLPQWLERGRGYLVNIASDLARRPLANMTPYVASKFGLMGFGASLHKEVRSRGIKVTTVCPGIIDSAFNDAQEGSKDRQWALPTDDLAARVIDLLHLPLHVTVDELTVHPADGDY
jgi:short-subunit dehydrogenase